MDDFLFGLIDELLGDIIPERLHTMLITGIAGVAGVILAGCRACAIYFSVGLAFRLAFGPAWSRCSALCSLLVCACSVTR